MLGSGQQLWRLPVEDPVLVVAVSLLVFLVAPLLLRQFEIPGIIGILVMGTVVGPNGVGLLQRDETIVLLGTVGINYLMFTAGLEIDVNDFLESPERSVSYAAFSFAFPFGLGTTVGVALLGFTLPTAMLFAAVFASHTLLALPVVDRLDLGTNEAVATTISGTIVTDTLALLVLAGVTRSVAGATGWLFWARFVFGIVLFFAGVWAVVPRIGRWYFRYVREESYFEFLFVLVVLFVSAFLGEVAGVEPIIGSFLAGLALNRLIPSTGTLMNRIEFVGNALFVPFFLLWVGMLVDPSVFVSGWRVWTIAAAIVGVLLVAKLLAAAVSGRVFGFSRTEQLTMFALSTGQAAATLAITLVGFERGFFDQAVVNGVVLTILVVGVLSPYLTERFGRDLVEIEEREEYEPREAPDRVLVPIVGDYSEAVERVLDFALACRDAESDEPLYALTVVRRTGGSTPDEAVADAEETLERATEYVAGADVPLESSTRVEYNTVSGIVHAVDDSRIATVVLPREGRAGFGRRIFGGRIEQLLDRTAVEVLVTDLDEPVNTADRLVVVIPGAVAANPGFLDGVHTVKRLGKQLGIPITGLLVQGDEERYTELIGLVEPETPFELESTSNWSSVYRSETGYVQPTDLVVALSPREDARGWEPSLRSLPAELARTEARNLVTVYLPEERTLSVRQLRF
ncbi:MAG: cation:proton antiporter [Haloferacaceae archaeon]